VLQQALQAIGLSMHETTTRYDNENEILTSIHIHVPSHVQMPRLKINTFYGNWCTTAEAALQSACSNTLTYLQEAAIVTIDDIHSTELKRCQHELLRASFWAEAFEEHAARLQSQLTAIRKCAQTKPTEVNLLVLSHEFAVICYGMTSLLQKVAGMWQRASGTSTHRTCCW
jgi:hypothetical protein